ncbi:CD2 antigen cytoplasmic tail-binding protein 2 [Phytophthora boehmeriae]|uniref:CD2 antigen cytoplasmic tail-binding protein 2 n=1 Tax=Phytophthora boehmeriae TaxID=109152 RepID=A0A8T1WMA0_9STRA|nr:CD2 antigen cytoplasmic tail-binding protein 2 [Phytophthora boehmeriae]
MADDDRRGMTAFNMEDEKDEGHFDDKGNFVWDDDAKKVQEEAWLDDVSEQAIGAAKSAKSRRDFRDQQAEETLTTEAANETLAKLLQPRETVLQALKRLGSKKNARIKAGNKRKQRAEDTRTEQEKRQFEQVTEAADFLMRIGEVDVYSQIKEEFIPEEDLLAQRRRVQFAEQEEGKSEEKPPREEVMWEYKATDGQIHGPYPTSSFVAWQQQGYFKGETAVDMRQVRSSSDTTGQAEQNGNKKQKVEPAKVSAEQEMLNDFDDSDEEEDPSKTNGKNEADENPWKRSDLIDFSSY